ncbi:MAG TPA: protein kinase [Thermoanaerobaculia bacterium]|jgi:serine/threonine protein kinase
MSKAAFLEASGAYSPGASIRNGERAWVLGEKISQGKFGAAFACRDDWGNPRVLQVLWPFSASYDNVREKWPQQAAELRRAQHPDLVFLLDGFEREGCFHLVHERCDQRLDRLLDQETGSRVWDGGRWFKIVARPVLCALDHAHQHGYVHRNLHPRNVLSPLPFEQLQPESVFSGAVKLADLAANTLLGKVDVLNMKLSRWLVPPEYLSPSECGPMDHRMDIYQAGLLLLSVLRGHVHRYSFEDIATGQPAKDAQGLAAEAGPVLARALSLQVAERFASALELWRALNDAEPLAATAGGALAQPSDLRTEFR